MYVLKQCVNCGSKSKLEDVKKFLDINYLTTKCNCGYELRHKINHILQT